MRNELTASRRYNKRDIALIHRRDERKRGSKKKKEKIIIDLSGKTRDPPETWVRKGQTDPVLATWYIRSKKDGLGLLEHSYPLTRNPIEGQGNRFFSLDGERSSFDGFWTYDDDPLGRIDSLMNDLDPFSQSLPA